MTLIEFLKKQEIEIPEEKRESLENEFKNEFQTENSSKQEMEVQIQNLQQQLQAANEQIQKFGDLDVTKIQEEVTSWKEKAAKAEEDGKKAINDLKLAYAIDSGLSKAGARNPKAVKALLDLSKIQMKDDVLQGLEEQLKGLKEAEDSSFLFQTSQGESGGRPSFGQMNEDKSNKGKSDDAEVCRIMGIPLKE